MNIKIVIIGLSLSIAIGISVAWWINSPSRFPEPTGATSAPTNAVRAPKPEVPTIPNLTPQSAELLPGFEKLEPCFSPTLTADLLTIVFSKPGKPGAGYDLFESTRSSIDVPFGVPVLIKATTSPETDAYPAISPDGLKLIYIRSDVNPELWTVRRKSRQESFRDNKRWKGASGDKLVRMGTPQFLNSSQVVYSQSKPDGARSLWISQLSGSNFSRSRLYIKQEGSPTLFLSNKGLRGYYCHGEGGLNLISRSSISQQYGLPIPLIPKEATGPVDGTVWISPQEDIMIYCSPGPMKEMGGARRLWQIAF